MLRPSSAVRRCVVDEEEVRVVRGGSQTPLSSRDQEGWGSVGSRKGRRRGTAGARRGAWGDEEMWVGNRGSARAAALGKVRVVPASPYPAEENEGSSKTDLKKENKSKQTKQKSYEGVFCFSWARS